MAHRTNVVQVGQDFEGEKERDQVTDPVCGQRITRQDANFLLFRGDDVFYFCSKECQTKYPRIADQKSARSKSKAA